MPENDLRDKALRLLTIRAHSTEELRQKLRQKFPKMDAEIDELLTEFTELKLLDDQSYATGLVRYRQETAPKGKFGLQMELRKKGISSEVISKVLSTINTEDEFHQARRLAEQKNKTFSEGLEKLKKKERLYLFLLSKGFEHEIALKVSGEMK